MSERRDALGGGERLAYTLPVIMYLAADRISSDDQMAIDSETLAQAFDRQAQPPDRQPSVEPMDRGAATEGSGDRLESLVRQEIRLAAPVLGDSDDPFEVELRARLRELAARAMATRALVRTRSTLAEVVDVPPVTTNVSAWLVAAEGALQECCDEGAPSPELVEDAARRLRAALSTVDECVDVIRERARRASEAASNDLEANYEWLRANSTLLGVQCSSASRCPVCLVNQVAMFNDPCGHTLCATCMSASGNACYMCRQPVRNRRRLFGFH